MNVELQAAGSQVNVKLVAICILPGQFKCCMVLCGGFAIYSHIPDNRSHDSKYHESSSLTDLLTDQLGCVYNINNNKTNVIDASVFGTQSKPKSDKKRVQCCTTNGKVNLHDHGPGPYVNLDYHL